jgi:cytochrome d ubiquinol oxidase subunit I
MFNAAWLHESIHGTIAAYVATGFAVAGVYAWTLLRGTASANARLGMRIAMGIAVVSIAVQFVAGDLAARKVADLQPEKFAAMEGQYQTEEGAPLRIGGIPTGDSTKFAIEIPKMLSFLGYRDFDATVTGLDAFPANDRPNETLTHLSFQAMVGSAFAMLGIAGWYWIAAWRRRSTVFRTGRWLNVAIVAGGFLGFLATQAGWFVTEVGRQPWVVRGYLRTTDAATTRDGVQIFFLLFTLLYVVISVALVVALIKWPRGGVQGGARDAANPTTEEASHVS